jgi:zinc transport system permease protein
VNILSALALPPILRGFLVLLVAAAAFPLTGVFVLRLNLITLRFMLMHGTLLGAAVGLATGTNPVLFGAAANLLLVILIIVLSREDQLAAGHLTTFFMVLSIGLAFAVVYRFDVPAKDTLSILWGSLFALTRADLWLTVAFCTAMSVLIIVLFRPLKAVLFQRKVAFTSGVAERPLYYGVLFATSLTVAFAVRLIGALLLDALLLLPAIMATFFARNARGMFVLAAATGVSCALAGFFLSLILDIPASSAVTMIAALVLGSGFFLRRSR